MKKKVRRIITIVVTILVLLVGFQITRKLLQNRKTEPPVSSIPVVAEYPEMGILEDSITYPGTLQPEKMVTVIPKTSGKLTELRVSEGDRIEEGMIIGTVEKNVTRLQMEQAEAAWHAAAAQLKKAERGVRPEELENARASLEQAEEDLEYARTNLERSRRLMEAGTISRVKFEESQAQYNSAKTELANARRNVQLMAEGSSNEDLDMARANADAAKAQYELAKLQYQNTEIEASVSGMVARVLVDQGSMVGPQVPLLVIVQDDPIYVEIPVPEKYYGIVNQRGGAIEARVNPAAYPDEDFFPGRVTNVAQIVDAESRTFTLEVAVENSARKLRPGMYVNVELILNKAENKVLVPESSLVYRNDTNVVFVVEEHSPPTAVMKKVDVGLRKNGLAQIDGGIELSDRIIIKGNAFLEEGQTVEIVDGSEA